ncbi:hypothetical protein [Streptomyces sp. DSM 118148]|uniref:hypothetical protein n=1 Tax=Streptomyces sp. DSM 118148 TaxID=3448667 RepID=UPI00403FEAC3
MTVALPGTGTAACGPGHLRAHGRPDAYIARETGLRLDPVRMARPLRRLPTLADRGCSGCPARFTPVQVAEAGRQTAGGLAAGPVDALGSRSPTGTFPDGSPDGFASRAVEGAWAGE